MVFLGKTPWCQSPTLGDLNRSSPWSHSPHGVYKVRSSSYVCWFISPFNLTIWLIPLMLRCEVVATYSNRWEIHHSQRILLDMIYIYNILYTWLVVSTPLKKYLSIGIIIPNIWNNKKCSKPPTSLLYSIYQWYILHRGASSSSSSFESSWRLSWIEIKLMF